MASQKNAQLLWRNAPSVWSLLVTSDAGMQKADLGVESSRCDHTDHLLLTRFRKGEQDAATQLYLRYAERLQAWASSQTSPALSARFDEEDVIQSVFRTFFRRVSEGLYDVPPGDELWQLLLVIALNKVRKLATYHRAQKRDVVMTHGGTTFDTASDDCRSRDEASLQILEMVIEDLLSAKSTTRRDIVGLRIDGYQIDEIAERTKRSKRTVERVLRDFRLELSAQVDVGTSHSES